MHNNNLSTLRNYFVTQLSANYSPAELVQLFMPLTTYITQLTKTQQLTEPNYRVTESQINSYNAAIAKLLMHTPLQYIIGYEWFFDLKFNVNQHTLIPRPETEELVAYILNKYSNKTNSLNIIDIGTGTGCIGISIKHELSNSTVTLCDISAQALLVAQHNATANNCEVTLLQSDILQWQQHTWPMYDVVVSNPPYVLESEKQTMHTNVLSYEPHSALFVPNSNPLLFYKVIASMAHNTLKPQGLVAVEINETLGEATAQLFVQLGFGNVQIINDLHQKHRFVVATKI